MRNVTSEPIDPAGRTRWRRAGDNIVQRARATTLGAMLLLSSAVIASPAFAASAEMPADLAAKVAGLLPSVAAIKTLAVTPQGRNMFSGSGFVIDPSGLILTNRHVIEGAYQISISLPGRAPMPGKALFISPVLDLALLKVDTDQPLPALTLADSDNVKVGDPVLLIGNALGLRTALSTGVISALNCDVNDTMYDHYIQTDAALNHGNSGGPMFDMHGAVIGINTELISSPGNTGSIGIGFAMPINDAKFLVNQFLKTGEARVGFSGVRAQRVTDDIAAAFGLKDTRGAIVTEVDPKGPAAGKIVDGDIVLRVNQQDASDMPAVARLVAITPNGGVLHVDLVRNDHEQTVDVPVRQIVINAKSAMNVLGHAPMGGMMFVTPANPGMTMSPITPALRAKYGLLADQGGVVITGVADNSAAAGLQISPGQVIERVGDQVISTPDNVREALSALKARHRPFAPFLIRGDQGPRWVPLPLDTAS